VRSPNYLPLRGGAAEDRLSELRRQIREARAELARDDALREDLGIVG